MPSDDARRTGLRHRDVFRIVSRTRIDMKILRWMLPLAFALVGVLPAGLAGGQEFSSQFPSRLIKLIVPYPPGGGVDGLARPIAERLGRLWGQSVIIESKPG